MRLRRGISPVVIGFVALVPSRGIDLVVEAFRSTSLPSETRFLSFSRDRRSIVGSSIPQISPESQFSSKRTFLWGMSMDEGVSENASTTVSIWDIIVTKVGSTTSMVVAGTFFVALCYKRDALMISFFVGAISNAIFGKVLKKLLKIERPDVDMDEDSMDKNLVPAIDRPSDNGMPSSHAMSLGFIFTFLAQMVPSMTIGLLGYAIISLVYRIRVNLHTVDQIVVGAILGTFDGAAWWHLCTNGFMGLNIVEVVSSSGILNENGLLPWYFLALPALIGAAVVGSVERRLSDYFVKATKKD
mmetsp:Transcript_8814/g.21567  ORF Transcript_8814/g.21567 Transcript_8814/m.21567 type:complete len:300 (-) Transcript_8814:922-1821(-)